MHDYLTGHPDDVAVLVSVELCSLTLQQSDDSMANLVSSGLFGDGAAAVVMVGADRAARDDVVGPDVVGTASRLYPDTEDMLGWDVSGSGFRIVLSASLSDVVERHLGTDVAELLADARARARRRRRPGSRTPAGPGCSRRSRARSTWTARTSS